MIGRSLIVKYARYSLWIQFTKSRFSSGVLPNWLSWLYQNRVAYKDRIYYMRSLRKKKNSRWCWFGFIMWQEFTGNRGPTLTNVFLWGKKGGRCSKTDLSYKSTLTKWIGATGTCYWKVRYDHDTHRVGVWLRCWDDPIDCQQASQRDIQSQNHHEPWSYCSQTIRSKL